VTRRKVLHALRRLRRRVAGLVRWEKRRDRITAKRRHRYKRFRGLYGHDDSRTVDALKAYRTSRRKSRKIDHTQAVLRARANNKLEWLREHPAPLDPDGDGLVVLDGRQVDAKIAREVLRIRRAGRWQGVVFSGYRTPQYSTSLCMGICGAPSCLGRCAGATSRHSQKNGNGAVDLSDYLTFASECARLDSWLENHLPNDLPHFSDIGN
jgi:hypothetical protein